MPKPNSDGDCTLPPPGLHCLPIPKCVDMRNLREWVTDPSRGRIALPAAWAIIRDHFCAAVVARGVCPVHCERCRKELTDLFRLEKAEKPEALLTWLAKDHSARWIEKLIALEKSSEQFPAQETDRDTYASLFPKRGDVNIFLELLKDYELD